MAVISEDFARSLSYLHRTVETLVRENESMKAEIEDLKKQVTKTDEVTTKRHGDAIRRAALQGDPQRISALANGINSPFEDEILRQAMPDEPIRIQDIQIDPHLYQGLLDAYATGKHMPQQTHVTVEAGPSHKTVKSISYTTSPNEVQREIEKAQREAEARRPKPQRGPGLLKGLSSHWDIENLDF